jgi:hypothetical protein
MEIRKTNRTFKKIQISCDNLKIIFLTRIFLLETKKDFCHKD